MSGVSSVKMPQHVPKVNSKWDGMPRKEGDGNSKRHSRSDPQRTSTASSSTRSRSVDTSGRRDHAFHSPDSSTASIPANRLRSRKSIYENEKRVGFDEVDSLEESVSSNNNSSSSIINGPRSQNNSVHTQSLRSPSATSQPRITSFFPNDIPEPPGIPQVYTAYALPRHSAQGASHEQDAKNVPGLEEPLDETRPGSRLSPSSTPLEQSPITPFADAVSVHHLGQAIVGLDDSMSFPIAHLELNGEFLRSTGPDDLDLTRVDRKASKESSRAFLAGEAQSLRLSAETERSTRPKSILKMRTKVFGPTALVQQDLEKRPDSSRARLGLRASMIRTSDSAPWEWDESKTSADNSSNRASMSKSLLPRGLGIFGKS